MIKILEEPHVNISIDHIENILYVEWTGEQTELTVRDGCGKMLALIKREKCRRILNDNTLVTGNWSGAAAWGAQEWFPAMYQAGCQFFAWVLSPDYYSQLSTKETLRQDIKGIIIFNFDTIASADNWLKAM